MHSSVALAVLVFFVSSIDGNVVTINNAQLVIAVEAITNVTDPVTACASDNDCQTHARCVNATCECQPGWTQFIHPTHTNESCSYQQRWKKTAFFVSFFTGLLGVDWFYLSRSSAGYITVGLLKLIVGLGFFSSWPLTYLTRDVENSTTTKTQTRGAITFFSLLAFAWWIFDWARIVGNKFADANGVALARW